MTDIIYHNLDSEPIMISDHILWRYLGLKFQKISNNLVDL